MRERGIKQTDVYAAWYNPDKTRYAKTKAAWVYYKNLNNRKVEVVAKKNEKGEWIILSVWSKEAYKNKAKKRKNILSCICRILGYNKNS